MLMPRITPDMNAKEVFLSVTEADVGAADVVDEIVDLYKLLEPQIKSAAHYLFLLDRLGMYGEDIYSFWKNVCDSRTETLIAVLIFYREGRITRESIENMNGSVANTILRRMCEMSSNFLPFYHSKAIKA